MRPLNIQQALRMVEYSLPKNIPKQPVLTNQIMKCLGLSSYASDVGNPVQLPWGEYFGFWAADLQQVQAQASQAHLWQDSSQAQVVPQPKISH